MGDNQKFIVGVNETQAPNQFKINPRLQRTRAGEPSVRQGLTLGTFVPNFPVTADKLVRLANRAVPLNPNFRQIIKVPKRDFIAFVDVPNPPALSKLDTGSGIVNSRRGRKNDLRPSMRNSRLTQEKT